MKNNFYFKDTDYNFEIQKLDYSIIGRILYMICSDMGDIFLLTDSNFFYSIRKHNYIDQYYLEAYSLEYYILQSENKESQIWCDKFGNHVIIKYLNLLYYFNRNIQGEKIKPLHLTINGIYLQPYAIGFNDEIYDIEDTGLILFSDFNSTIYEFQIKFIDQSNIQLMTNSLFSFSAYFNDEDDIEFCLFKMYRNEKILDIKIFCKNNILILAITQYRLFQFFGKDSFREVFDNYSKESRDIFKTYKRFNFIKNINRKKSKIQELLQHFTFFNKEIFKIPHLTVSFMSEINFCIGITDSQFFLEPKPINKFIIFMFGQNIERWYNTFRKIPIACCQSELHIFYLYNDEIVVRNKITNNHKIIKDFKDKFIDMYFIQNMNEIILYSEDGVYKIPLLNERRYLWETFLEKGYYYHAINVITNKDKYMKPILYRKYASYLFEKKNFLESALYYVFSDETFENVCLKFLAIDKNDALLKYIYLIFHFKFIKNSKKKYFNENNFIDKYLLNAWLFELFFQKKSDTKRKRMEFIKDYSFRIKYLLEFSDNSYIYLYLKKFVYLKELMEYASINEDHEEIILDLINLGKIRDALGYIKTFLLFKKSNDFIRLIFYKYFFFYKGKA